MQDWLGDNMTKEQKARFQNCWVLLAEQPRKPWKTFVLRPYLYEQFFAADAQQRAVPMILDVLTILSEHLPVIIHFYCKVPKHPAASMLSACAESFGRVVRDTGSPSFLLVPEGDLPIELLGALLFDPDSAFHVMCYVPQCFLLDKMSAMPYAGCLWYLEHGMGRMRLDYLSGRPMLEIQMDRSITPEFLMGRMTPMIWRHGYRLVLHKE